MCEEGKNQSVGSDVIKGSLVDLCPGASHILLCTPQFSCAAPSTSLYPHLLLGLPSPIALPGQKSGPLGLLDTWILKSHLNEMAVLSTMITVCEPHRSSRME